MRPGGALVVRELLLFERAGELRDEARVVRRKAANTARREQLGFDARHDRPGLPVFEQAWVDGERDQSVGANRGVDPGVLRVARLTHTVVGKVGVVAPEA